MKTKYGMGGCLSRDQAETLPLADVWNRFHDLNVLYCGVGNKEEREMLEEVLKSRVSLMVGHACPCDALYLVTSGIALRHDLDGGFVQSLENRAASYMFIAWLTRKGGNP